MWNSKSWAILSSSTYEVAKFKVWLAWRILMHAQIYLCVLDILALECHKHAVHELFIIMINSTGQSAADTKAILIFISSNQIPSP
jgi:hypothetical protein